MSFRIKLDRILDEGWLMESSWKRFVNRLATFNKQYKLGLSETQIDFCGTQIASALGSDPARGKLILTYLGQELSNLIGVENTVRLYQDAIDPDINFKGKTPIIDFNKVKKYDINLQKVDKVRDNVAKSQYTKMHDDTLAGLADLAEPLDKEQKVNRRTS